MTAVAGAAALFRLAARRDRWLLALWVGLLAAYPMLMVAYTEDLNPTAAQREEYVGSLAGNAAFTMMYGPVNGSSVGALATWRDGDALWIAALISLLLVVRHTRTDEEAGRRELLGATVVGRHAGLAAALAVTVTANLAAAGLAALGMIGQGLPAGGAAALGLKPAMVGIVFAALAAVAAQLTQTAAAARTIAIAALGVAFLLRAASDTAGPGAAGSWPGWLSPLGWAHRIRPFAGEQWWLLALSAAATTGLTALAVAFARRRDVGAGVVRPRPGRVTAAAGLRSPLALAWRLHRGLLFGWVSGLTLMSAVLSGTAKSAADLFRTSPQVQEMFRRLGSQAQPGDMYLSGTMALLGLIAAAYAVQATLRLRTEEDDLRAEPVLATAVPRPAWIVSHLTFALLGPALALGAAGLAAGVLYGLAIGDLSGQLPRVLAGAIVQVPGVWLLAGLGLALYGVHPRLAAVAWGVWSISMGIWLLGTSLQLDRWLQNLSPFTHLPKLPGGQANATPLLWLVATTALAVAVGVAAFRRRDVGRT